MLSKSAMRIFGTILFVIGFVILYALNKRKFYRRTMTGAEVFKSFERSWATRMGEGCLRVIGWFLLLGGASGFLLSYE